MTIHEFKLHKIQWWKNYILRLKCLETLFEKSCYTTYEMTMGELWAKYQDYIKTFINLKFFPIDLSVIKIDPAVKADREILNAQLLPLMRRTIKTADDQISRLSKNIDQFVTLMQPYLNDLKFVTYKTDWVENYQYCVLSYDRFDEGLKEFLRRNKVSYKTDETKKELLFYFR